MNIFTKPNSTLISLSRLAMLFCSVLVLVGCDKEVQEPEEVEHEGSTLEALNEVAQTESDETEVRSHKEERDVESQKAGYLAQLDLDFGPLEWGMSSDEAAANLERVDHSGPNEIIVENTEFLGVKARKLLEFRDGGLETIVFSIDTSAIEPKRSRVGESGAAGWEQFSEIQNKLDEKFGEFEKDYQGFGILKDATDLTSFHEGMQQLQSENGDFIRHTWTEPNDGVVIRHWLQFTNGPVNHHVAFINAEQDEAFYEFLMSAWEFSSSQ